MMGEGWSSTSRRSHDDQIENSIMHFPFHDMNKSVVKDGDMQSLKSPDWLQMVETSGFMGDKDVQSEDVDERFGRLSDWVEFSMANSNFVSSTPVNIDDGPQQTVIASEDYSHILEPDNEIPSQYATDLGFAEHVGVAKPRMATPLIDLSVSDTAFNRFGISSTGQLLPSPQSKFVPSQDPTKPLGPQSTFPTTDEPEKIFSNTALLLTTSASTLSAGHSDEHSQPGKVSNPPHPPKPRKFPCDANGCGRSYKRRYELHRHQKIHSGIRDYSCRFVACQRANENGFARKDHLRQHLRQVHDVSI